MNGQATAKLTTTAQQLLLALWRADEDGDGWVQIENEKLARLAGFLGRNWFIDLHGSYLELEQRGLLLVLTAERPAGGYDPNVYILREEGV